jgi:asparagine N-glycosylation enzyme membrane subunit Stt3
MWEKLGGLAVIAVAVVVLSLISVFEPPLVVQIVSALAGSLVFLFGVVVLFAEGQLFTKDRRGQRAPKGGQR